MIVIAFVVPLGLLARSTAMDTAMDRARAASAGLVPLVAADNHPLVENRVDELNRSGTMEVTVMMEDGALIGVDRPIDGLLARSLRTTRSLTGPVDGGHEITTVVSIIDNRLAVIAVVVSDDTLTQGVAAAWFVLGLLGLALILLAVLLADRLAARIVEPARNLSSAVSALGDRNFDVHLTPEGPPEFRTTATAFNLLIGRVQSMLADERNLMTELAHRLRTPLTRLRIDVEQVDDHDLADRLNRDIDALSNEINYLIGRVRQTVDPPTPVDVAELARRRFNFWARLAAEEERDCTFDADGPVVVSVDPDDLEGAIDILIENVFAHTEPGVPFRVGVDRQQNHCHLTVEDGGPGFDPALIDAGRSTQGSTGLGLAIVDRLAAKYGGELVVGRSDLGGARVECRFRAPGSTRANSVGEPPADH